MDNNYDKEILKEQIFDTFYYIDMSIFLHTSSSTDNFVKP